MPLAFRRKVVAPKSQWLINGRRFRSKDSRDEAMRSLPNHSKVASLPKLPAMSLVFTQFADSNPLQFMKCIALDAIDHRRTERGEGLHGFPRASG